MASGLETLRADDVGARFACLHCVLWMSAHVHVQNVVGVELFNNVRRRDSHGRDKQTSAALDNDVDLLIEGTSREVVLRSG